MSIETTRQGGEEISGFTCGSGSYVKSENIAIAKVTGNVLWSI